MSPTSTKISVANGAARDTSGLHILASVAGQQRHLPVAPAPLVGLDALPFPTPKPGPLTVRICASRLPRRSQFVRNGRFALPEHNPLTLIKFQLEEIERGLERLKRARAARRAAARAARKAAEKAAEEARKAERGSRKRKSKGGKAPKTKSEGVKARKTKGKGSRS